MAIGKTYYLVFHCACTGGVSDIGSEEQEIIAVTWIFIDGFSNKVMGSQHSIVKPTHKEIDPIYAERLGFSREHCFLAKPLDDILRQLHQFVLGELHLERGVEVVPVTAGPIPIRQCLHAETAGKNMEVPDYFYQYIDILEVFKKILGGPIMLHDLANFLKVDISITHESKLIATAVHHLISERNHELLASREIINRKLETAPCTKTDCILENTVIKVRGLPWQCSDQDVAKFFRGLNIAKGGVALCLNAQGRRNGEALVRFENEQHQELALKRHKRHLGNRYIEVYKSSSDEFLKIAADSNNEAVDFLSKGDNIIVKMRGLPFTATCDDVRHFFGEKLPVVGGQDGILFVRYPDSRSTGDAFVQFATEEEANEALKLHKHNMKDRYIELFRSTAAEVIQVMKRFSCPPLLPNGPPNISPGLSIMYPTTQIPAQLQQNCLKLRGLPLTVNVEDIIKFMGEHSDAIKPAGIHMVLNTQGRPSGECFMQMTCGIKAAQAALECNRQMINGRPVEVTQCGPEEMNSYFVGATQSYLTANSLSPTTFLPQFMPPVPTQGLRPSATTLATATQHAMAAYFTNTGLIYYPHYPTPLTPPISPQTSSTLFYQQPNFTLVRMKNLPSDVSIGEIMNFYSGYHIPECAIQPAIISPGKGHMECFVTFYSPEIAQHVVEEKNKTSIRQNTIELSIA